MSAKEGGAVHCRCRETEEIGPLVKEVGKEQSLGSLLFDRICKG